MKPALPAVLFSGARPTRSTTPAAAHPETRSGIAAAAYTPKVYLISKSASLPSGPSVLTKNLPSRLKKVEVMSGVGKFRIVEVIRARSVRPLPPSRGRGATRATLCTPLHGVFAGRRANVPCGLTLPRERATCLKFRARRKVDKMPPRTSIRGQARCTSILGSFDLLTTPCAATVLLLSKQNPHGDFILDLEHNNFTALHFSNTKDRFQSSFMSTTVQPFACASSRALSSWPMCDLRS